MARPAEAPSAGLPALLRGALLLAGLVGAGYVARRAGSHVLFDIAPNAAGAAGLFAGGALLTAVALPRQAVAFAGGYIFGAWRGAGLALAAQLLGCTLDYWWARAVARDWARDWAIRKLRGRLARVDRLMVARPFAATLALRLLPIGSNVLVNLLAGVSGLRAIPFLTASLLGYLPQTVIFALAGSGVHVARTTQIALAVGLFAVSATLGTVLLRNRDLRGSALEEAGPSS